MVMLTTEELARRWRMNENTLRRWRLDGSGPNYIKMGEGPKSSVRYRLTDIENFEDRYYQTINKAGEEK
jgi:hypothetical protein